MAYRSEDIQNLLDNLKIEEVVGEFVDLKKSGSSYKGLCPFHADTNPSFMVTPSKNICKCFSCGAGGNPITFYSKIKNISFQEAAGELAKKYGYTLRNTVTDKDKDAKFEKYYEIMDMAAKFYQKNIFDLNSRAALEYLAKRDVNSDIIMENQLGFASNKRTELYDYLLSKDYKLEDLLSLGLVKKTEDGRYYDTFRNRIIFPIFSSFGRVIAFGGRTLEQSKDIPKYINSPETAIFKKGYSLYGVERIKIIKQKNYAVLMEGYMDVLSAYIYNIDTALAPLGTALTEEQVALLKKYTSNVILAFDSDMAGLAATEKAGFLLKKYNFQVRVVGIENAKDPDEFLKKYGREKFLELIKNSKEIFDFLYDIYAKDYDLKDNIAKQKFIERFSDFFVYLSDLDRAVYLSTLAKKLNLDVEILKNYFSVKKNKKHKKEHKTLVHTLEEKETKIKIKDLHLYNFEMDVIKYIFSHPFRYYFFENENFEEELAQKIKKYFFDELKENFLNSKKENVKNYSNKLVEDFKVFLESTDKLSREEKEICRNDIVMDIFTSKTFFKNEREEIQLYKSFLRYKLKKFKEKNKIELDKIIKLKTLELKADKQDKIDDFIEIYHEIWNYL